MEKKKSYGVLIAGAILLILGIVLAVITHNNSYQESVAYGSQLSDVKAQLEEVEASIEAVTGGTADGDLDALNAQKDELSAQKSTLSDQKLSAERPYSYSLVLVFFAILLTAKGLYNAIAGVIPAQKADVKKLAQAGLLAALCSDLLSSRSTFPWVPRRPHSIWAMYSAYWQLCCWAVTGADLPVPSA